MSDAESGRPPGQGQGAAALQILFKQGLKLHRQGNSRTPSAFTVEVLQRQPDHVDALYLLGLIAAHTRRTEQAVELFSKAIKLNEEMAAAHNELANALLSLKRPDQALTSYDRAIALKPDYAEAYRNR